jgi:hypothetical protein
MPDFWRGYVSANDDVRHTYEQVFYGHLLPAALCAGEAARAAPARCFRPRRCSSAL